VVVLAGLNLRAVFASLPPLLDRIRDDLGLSASVAGLLTTCPVLCFGLLAPLAPRVVRRVSIEWVVCGCAAVTGIGAAVRGFGTVAALFAGAVLAGASVAIAQALLPVLVRTRFAGHTGALTGSFSMALTLGAALASGLAVPLTSLFGGSWRAGLAVFAVPALVAALAWLRPATANATRVQRKVPLGVLRDRRAWSVALFFAFQSMVFYAGLTWLPSVLQSEGYSEAAAGGLLALANVSQLAPALLVPVVVARRGTQTGYLVALAVVAALAMAGVSIAPSLAALWMVALGIAWGGALGLALMPPMLRGANVHAVASLTAMALSVGYLVAASGPWIVGLAHDLTDGWGVPVAVMVAMTLAEIVVGVPATRAWRVGADAGPVASETWSSRRRQRA
jgi:MFS transporter, CP family, cyanate transporter